MPGLKETYIQLKTRMDKAVEDFRKAMARPDRPLGAHARCVPSNYGSQMPLNQIATVHAPEPQLITVQPFDPFALAHREGHPHRRPRPEPDERRQDHPRARPALTEERRKDMVKHLHKVLEEHRTAVRNIRRDGNDAIKKAMKDKKITEDEEKAGPRRDPETDRRRNQEDGRHEQGQRERSDGDL